MLEWTAPGDDGNVGTAATYEMRYRAAPVVGSDTTGWWAGATAATGLPVPQVAGTRQSVTLSGPFAPGTTWWFVMKACDERPNCSGFSNVAEGTIPPPDGVAPAPVITFDARVDASVPEGTVALWLRAPATEYVGPGCPDVVMMDNDGAYRVGPPLTDLKEILIRGVRFDVPGDTVDIGPVPAIGAEGDSLAFDFEGEPGVQGSLLAYAIDLSGNVACSGGQYVFVVPDVEPPSVVPGLLAEYFDDMDLTVPFGSRVDPQINFDWDAGAPMPGMGVETFSASWTGSLTVAGAGAYRFRARVEDAVKLWVKGTQIMDDWVPQSEHNVIGTIALTPGSYAFRFDYFARNGNAMARLFWTPPGGVEMIVPASDFSHSVTP